MLSPEEIAEINGSVARKIHRHKEGFLVDQDGTSNDFHSDFIQWNLVENLLSKSSKTSIERNQIRDELVTIESLNTEDSYVRYWEIIKDLKESAIDPIAYGRSYQQKDILRHLKNLV